MFKYSNQKLIFINYVLFSDFFPVILSTMRNLPIIGNILNKPAVREVSLFFFFFFFFFFLFFFFFFFL